MPGFRLQNFTGQIPKLDKQLVPDGAAQASENTSFTSGRIESLYSPKEVASARSTTVMTIYRMFLNGNEAWLTWEEDVDIAESPVFVQNDFRIIFTSEDFEPRQTNYSLATSATPYPAAYYALGVYAPETAPTVTGVTGGSGTNVTRVYVYTFVTAWGEESAPSPASAAFSGLPDGTWAVSIPDTAPPNSFTISASSYVSTRLRLTVNATTGMRAGDRVDLAGMNLAALNTSWKIDEVDSSNNYFYITMPSPSDATAGGGATVTRQAAHNTTGMTKRVYRSVTSTSGTEYFLVGTDIPAATTTFDDDTLTDVSEPLPSLGWLRPPTNLKGVVVHPSGSIVGFDENKIYISEPYSPYAFPQSYELTLDYPIVGLAVFGQSVFVGTVGKPYVVTFADPAAASPRKMDENWPCLSKRGIVTFSGGVFFPTTTGLAFVGSTGAQLVTERLYAQRDWEELMPETFIGAHYDGKYYAIYNNAQGSKSIVIISESENVTKYNYQPTAFFTDREDGQIYVAFDGSILKLNDSTSTLNPYSWTSKEIRVLEPINLGAAQIDFTGSLDQAGEDGINDQNEVIEAANLAKMTSTLDDELNVNDINTVEVNYDSLTDLIDVGSIYYLSFTLWGDGELIYTTPVTNSKMFRLPTGKKYSFVEIRVNGTAPIQSIVFADTPFSLKSV